MAGKHKCSVLDDPGSGGLMHITRQKANLLSTQSLISSQPTWELERSNGSKMACKRKRSVLDDPGSGGPIEPKQKASKAIVENGKTRMHNSGYAFVPIKSTQMASKILEHLERTTPKEKPSSSRLGGVTEKSATKLTSNLALGSLDKVESSKFLQSSHNNQKSEGHHHIDENGPQQFAVPLNVPSSMNGNSTAPKKPAFQMSAPKDSEVLDDDNQGIDVDEIFSLVVKPTTIRTVLSLAISRHWPVHQLDVKNAFLNGYLSETIYMQQPLGFRDSQHPDYKYATKVLECAGMLTCNPCRTPVDTDSKFSTDALKRILRYVRGTLSYGLQLYSSTTSTLVAYSDADWAGCPTTHRSTFGYCVFLGNNLLSWSSKRQFTISRSSAEAEYQGVANAVAETCWLCNLLRELHTLLSTATLVYCDNVSAVYLSSNPVQHQRTKHIEIDIHFVRDLVSIGRIRVLHVPSRYQYADIFTKGLPTALFDEFRSSLSIRSSPA
nr:ribonuclease H-like domain-containing protein [Tanacetum cinerariifolium]